jgi:hypothetical protein
MDSYFFGIDIRVRMTSRKAGVKKKAAHFGISSSRSLLKTRKRFLKATNKVGVILDIARRLFHVDFFLQIPMQEGRFNIHLKTSHLCEATRARTRRMEFILATGERFQYSQCLQPKRTLWKLTRSCVFQHFHLMHT